MRSCWAKEGDSLFSFSKNKPLENNNFSVESNFCDCHNTENALPSLWNIDLKSKV